MQHHLHAKLSLPELAAAVALSASRFSHLFKTQTGVSPARCLKSMRLQKARDLLEGSNLIIKDVAVHVGLNPSAFSASFREIYGVTPLQYRSACLQSPAGWRGAELGDSRFPANPPTFFLMPIYRRHFRRP